jgi:hypothetical protein
MNVFLYYRTYWGLNSKTGWLGKNVLANSKMEMVKACYKSMEFDKIDSTINLYKIACVDNSCEEYSKYLEQYFDEVFHTNEGLDVTDTKNGWIPLWGMKGALIKLHSFIKSKNHKPDDIILIIEDDYLFAENGFIKWINACCHFNGFVTPYDHSFNYYRNDMFLKLNSIEIFNNMHWRESTCNTSVVGGKYQYFKKTNFFRKIPRLVFGPFYIDRFLGRELPSIDVLFYRRIRLFLGVKLFSPIPGLSQHLSKWPNIDLKHMKNKVDLPPNELSAGVKWEERYIQMVMASIKHF